MPTLTKRVDYDRLAILSMICRDIANDMRLDAERFDGQPFNGRTVAEYFGNQGAAIAGLARILEAFCEAQQDAALAVDPPERRGETPSTPTPKE